MHCYGFFAGGGAWEAMQDEEPGTFYLTDFLARHFEALVLRPLGLDRYPELVARRLRQLPAGRLPRADGRCRADGTGPGAAATLGLAFERRFTGYGELRPALETFVARAA